MYEFGSGSGTVVGVCFPQKSVSQVYPVYLASVVYRSLKYGLAVGGINFFLWCRRITLWKRGSTNVRNQYFTISALIANSCGPFGRNSCCFLTVNFRLSQNDLFSRPGTLAFRLTTVYPTMWVIKTQSISHWERPSPPHSTSPRARARKLQCNSNGSLAKCKIFEGVTYGTTD